MKELLTWHHLRPVRIPSIIPNDTYTTLEHNKSAITVARVASQLLPFHHVEHGPSKVSLVLRRRWSRSRLEIPGQLLGFTLLTAQRPSDVADYIFSMEILVLDVASSSSHTCIDAAGLWMRWRNALGGGRHRKSLRVSFFAALCTQSS